MSWVFVCWHTNKYQTYKSFEWGDQLVNDTIAHKYNHQLPTKPHDNQWNDQYTLLSTVQLQSKLRKHRSLGVQNLSKQTSDIYRLRTSDNLWYYHFTYLWACFWYSQSQLLCGSFGGFAAICSRQVMQFLHQLLGGDIFFNQLVPAHCPLLCEIDHFMQMEKSIIGALCLYFLFSPNATWDLRLLSQRNQCVSFICVIQRFVSVCH